MSYITKAKSIKVLFTATAISFISGILYIWSIISKDLVKHHGWTSIEASLPYTVCIVSLALMSVITGRIQDKIGPRVCASLGGIFVGGGLVISGFAIHPKLMLLTFGIIISIGFAFINASVIPAVIKWFPSEKKGLVTGIVVAGAGFASVFYSPVFSSLIVNKGISKAFFFLGAGVLVSLVFLAQFLKNPPVAKKDKTSNVQNAKDVVTNSTELTPKEIVKTLSFYRIWFMYAFSSAAGLMIIGHIANIANKQANWDNSYLLVMLLAVFNTIGRLLGGAISDKLGRINVLRMAFIIFAINIICFRFYTFSAILVVGVALAGVCYGSFMSTFPAVTADFFGVKNLGGNYGLVFTAWGLGGVIGPMTAAVILDKTGNYNVSYFVSFILLVIAILITFTFKAGRVKRDGGALQ